MLLRTILGVVTLFLSLTLLVMGNAMLGTIAALRLEIAGHKPEIIGLVLALTALGFVLGSVYGIRVVQRVGHIRAFAVFAAVAAAAAVAHPLYVSVAAWMVLRLVLGFCIAGLMLVTESWVNGYATAQTRGALLATYMVLFFLAASSGQFLVTLGDPGMHYLFVVAGILILLSLVQSTSDRQGVLVVVRGVDVLRILAVGRQVPGDRDIIIGHPAFRPAAAGRVVGK